MTPSEPGPTGPRDKFWKIKMTELNEYQNHKFQN